MTVRRISRQEQRRRLLGSLKYVPALAVVFGALLVEAHISNQLRTHDYEQNDLNRAISALEAELVEIQVRAAQFQNVDMLNEQAMVLGMVDARPEQFVHITAPGYEPVLPENRSGEVLARVRPWDSLQNRDQLRGPLQDTADAVVAGEEFVASAAPAPVQAAEEKVPYNQLDLLDEDPRFLLGTL